MKKFEFLELLGQPAIVLDTNFTILYANQYAKERFASIANLKLKSGIRFIDIFHQNPEYYHLGKFVEDVLRTMEKEGVTHNNQRIHIHSSLAMQVAIKRNFSEDIGYFWVITGINITRQTTEEKKIQMRIREQLEVFKILFDMAPVGLGIKDFEGGFYKVNQGLCEITGYPREELLKINPHRLFPDYNLEKEQELVKYMLETNSRYFKRERQILTASQTRKIVSETLSIIRDDGQIPFLIIVSYLDITDEKELQKLLIEARKMEELGKLSGGIAHDFNNMLLPVTLCSDIALQELEGADFNADPRLVRIKNYIEKISVAAQKAKTLVQKLFQYSQTGLYELKPIYLEKELEKAIEIIQLQKPSHLEIRLDIEEGSYPILGEGIWIEQILDNLVVNAFHAMKFRTEGFVTIRLFSEYGDAILEVIDEGIGIEDAELQKIFQPFYTKKDSSEGTGMGLTIVQAMVHKMNGKIRVFSLPGRGTLFQILFPLWKESEKTDMVLDRN